MRLSTLIAELEHLRAEKGDIEVKLHIPETELSYGGDFDDFEITLRRDIPYGDGSEVFYVLLDRP
jgi:hypothetical protein